MVCNTSLSACNTSTAPGSFESDEKSELAQMIVLTILSILGLAGNLIILTTGVKCLCCLTDLRLRQDSTPSFVRNLAVADILILTYCVPLHLCLISRVPMNDFVCRYLVPLRDVFALTSILTIMAISLERAVAVKSPFSLERLQKYTRYWIVVIWVVSYLIAGLPMVFVMDSQSGQFCVPQWSSIKLRNAHQASAILLIVIPGIVTTLSYMCCLRSLHKLRQRRKNTKESSGVMQWSFITQTRTISRIAMVLVAVFWMCNLPLVTYAILSNYEVIAHTQQEHTYTTAVLTCFFYGASFMNPIVLISMSQQYRDSAVSCVQCLLSRGNFIMQYRFRVQFTRESTNRTEHISIPNNEAVGENNNSDANGVMLMATKVNSETLDSVSLPLNVSP